MDDREELEAAGRVWRRKLLSLPEAVALARHCDLGEKRGLLAIAPGGSDGMTVHGD